MTAARSLTGSPTTDALVPLASELVWAVHTLDAGAVEAIRSLVGCSCSCDHSRIWGLLLITAGMTPDDVSPGDALGWLGNPEAYQRFRDAGFGAYAAMRLARDKGGDG